MDKALVDQAKCFIGFNKDLRTEQYTCLQHILEGNDTLAILPTGFGKSIIYQLIPFVYSLKNNISLSNTKSYVLVITPLNSIMIDQCQALSKLGVKACALDYSGMKGETFSLCEDSESDEERESNLIISDVKLDDIANGKFQVVYCHPEALISAKGGDALLKKIEKKQHLVCIAIDEAHMILEW